MNYERTIEKIQGEVATLLCEVEGIPAPTVTWKKNYVQIDTESDLNYDILEDGSLLIKQVKVLLVTFFKLSFLSPQFVGIRLHAMVVVNMLAA